MTQFWPRLPEEIDYHLIRSADLHPHDLGRAYAEVEAEDVALHNALAVFAVRHEVACKVMSEARGGVSFRYPDQATGEVKSLYSDFQHPFKDYLMGSVAARGVLQAKAAQDEVAFPKIDGEELFATELRITGHYNSGENNPVDYLTKLQAECNGLFVEHSEFSRVTQMGSVLRRIGSMEMIGLVANTLRLDGLEPIETEGPVFGYVARDFAGIELPPQKRQVGEL